MAAVTARADEAKTRLQQAAHRRPWLDHGLRSYARYREVLGNQLAAAITYFGFLSFFPLVALAFAVVGYVTDGDPHAQQVVTDAIDSIFPGLIGTGPGQLDIQDIIDAKTGATIIGVLGLAYAGLGLIDALRDALRRVFGTSHVRIAFVRKKAIDAVVLAALGTAMLASVVVSSLATSVTRQVLGHVGLDDSRLATVLLKVLSVCLALLADTVLFGIVLSRLSGAHLRWSQVRSGALLGAVAFELLKLVGTFLIGKTTTNPLYATFGVVVGLLVWINFVSKVLVHSAAWAYTTGPATVTVPARAVAPSEDEAGPRRWRGSTAGALAGATLAVLLTRRRAGRPRARRRAQ